MSDTGLVGPATVRRDDPNSAATIAGTMAQYRPYSGGRPASVAKATPWGSTTMAPTRPASASAFNVAEPTSGHHFRNGSKRSGKGRFDTIAFAKRDEGKNLWYQTGYRHAAWYAATSRAAPQCAAPQ